MRMSARAIPAAPVLWPLFLLAAFSVSWVLAALVPSFQAPDEYDHTKRAYMLSQGQLLLHSVDGSPSGGEVDSGLVAYMEHFTPLKGQFTRKISTAELLDAKGVQWSHDSVFQTPVGTAYYFPLMYAPQAIGLATGRALGMSVDNSYQLARALSWMTCLLLLMLAGRIYTPSAAALALFALPMNLFLFASAVLDPMASAVSFVAVASFMRYTRDRATAPRWMFVAMCLSVALVSACRANMLPLLLLPFVSYLFVRERRNLIWAAVIAVLVLAWTLFTVKTTVYPDSGHRVDHAARVASFLMHPGQLLSILFNTWTDDGLTSFYGVSFVGVLGWLDAPFSMSFYHLIGFMLGGVLLLSLTPRAYRDEWLARSTLLVVALAAVVLTFLALLVQWTAPDAVKVDGVQGRYFMIPCICLAYALTADLRPRRSILFFASHGLLLVLLLLTSYATTSLLMARYYTVPQPLPPPRELAPSPVLTHSDRVELHFSAAQQNSPARLSSLDVRFGTYMATHQGRAELQVWTQDGAITKVPFELSTLVDNGYQRFPLDGKPYVGGAIVSADGQGVSVWESRLGADDVLSCVVYHSTDDRTSLADGCPVP